MDDIVITRKQERVIVGVVSALVIVSAVAFLYNPGSSEVDETPEDLEYASANEDTVSVSEGEPDKVFAIESYGVDPYRRSMKLGELAGFENNRNNTVTITFDRSSKEIDVAPGDTSTLRITGTTYIDIESSTGWKGQAQVYVE